MKTRFQQIALTLLFLVVYDLSVFLLVEEMTDSRWISLAFIHFAYAVFLYAIFSVPSGKHGAVIGYPGVTLATQYFLIQLALGTVYMIIGTASVAWTVIPQMALAAVYLAIMIINSMTNQKIVADVARDERHTDYMRQTVASLQRIKLDVVDADLIRRLSSVEDALRYAQVASDSSVAGLEADTMASLDRLSAAVRSGDNQAALALCDSIEKTVALRNTTLSARSRT